MYFKDLGELFGELGRREGGEGEELNQFLVLLI